jgi:hypothetical protein
MYPIYIYFINVFVAKLGTAATGKFLSGKRERQPLCNIAKLNRISGLPKKLLNL